MLQYISISQFVDPISESVDCRPQQAKTLNGIELIDSDISGSPWLPGYPNTGV